MYRRFYSSRSFVISLVIINAVIFLFTNFIQIPVPRFLLIRIASKVGINVARNAAYYGLPITLFSLYPILISKMGWIWQVFTYMFLHGSLLHIFFNMYALYLFGSPLEQKWGSGRFLVYYLLTGIGAGAVTFLWNNVKNPFIPTIGASGAIFGVMLAFGLEFPDTMLLLFFLLPVKAKYAAIIFGGIELIMLLTGSMQRIGHFTHLSGLFFGYVYYLLIIKRRKRPRYYIY